MGFDFSSLDLSKVNVPVNTMEIENKNLDKIKEGIGYENILFYLNKEDRRVKQAEVVTKVSDIITQLNNSYIEREEEITMLIIALISSTNAFLHGPAGTGKSQLTEDLSRRIQGSNYFRILMGKTTEPSEVFGPVSLMAMKNDIYKVNTDNKLPSAQIAFVDEVFKANSAILNSLLTIMNEKLFFNDVVEEVPLISMIGASNEFIEEDSLVALYDRFLLRWHVDYIQDSSKRVDLFKNFLNSRKTKSKLGIKDEVAVTTECETTITIDELLFLNELCKEVDIPIKILKVYNKLFATLEKAGIVISDRRKNEGLKIIQATALLSDRNKATSDDFINLKYALWNDINDIPIVIKELSLISNPDKTKYEGYLKSFNDLKRDLANIELEKGLKDYHHNKTLKITETNKQLHYILNEINKIISNIDKSDPSYSKYFNLKDSIVEFMNELVNKMI